MVQLQYIPYDYDTCGGYGRKRFWRILLDGKARWSNAKPFSASDDAIALAECLECCMCGGMSTWVRRSCDNVVWLASQNDKDVPVLEPGEVIVFDVRRSTKPPCGKVTSRICQNCVSANCGDSWTAFQFPRLIWRSIESLRYPMTTLGGCHADAVAGIFFLDRHGSLRVCRAPTTFVETRIGLELPGVPELVYWTPDLTLIEPICFAANPSFPLWLCSR